MTACWIQEPWDARTCVPFRLEPEALCPHKGLVMFQMLVSDLNNYHVKLILTCPVISVGIASFQIVFLQQKVGSDSGASVSP